MSRLLIKDATIISMDNNIGALRSGSILLEDQKILEVGENIEADAEEVVNGREFIVIPGLVNEHQHTWQTGIRGIAGDWPMGKNLRSMHASLGPQFRPDDIYIGNHAGAL